MGGGVGTLGTKDVLDIVVSDRLSTACTYSESQSNFFYLSQTRLWVVHACSECTGVLYPIETATVDGFADA